MSITVEGLKSSPKSWLQVWVDGKLVPVAEHYYICHYNDLVDTFERWRAKYTRQAKMGVAACERRWEGRTDMPTLAISDSHRKDKRHLDGVWVSHWESKYGTMTDCDMKGAGILRQVVARDGKFEWVLFPVPACRYCEDTGVISQTIETMPQDRTIGMYAEPRQRCPFCEGEHAAQYARNLWMAKQEQRRITKEAADVAHLATKSLDSAGL